MSTGLIDNYTYNILYRISLFISFQYVLPTLALVYLNSRVIVALRRSDTYRQSTVRRYPPPPMTSHQTEVVTSSSQSTRSITMVVAVIVTICIVVHVVALTAHVIATVQVSSCIALCLSVCLSVTWGPATQQSKVATSSKSDYNFPPQLWLVIPLMTQGHQSGDIWSL